MKVKELIQALQAFDQEADVYIYEPPAEGYSQGDEIEPRPFVDDRAKNIISSDSGKPAYPHGRVRL